MPTNTRSQISRTLLQFYDKPIAQVSLELFFTVVAVIIFAMFAIRPTLSTMGKLIKELEDKEALNQKLAEKAAALSSAQAQYNDVDTRLSILDIAVPTTPQFQQAVLIIEKIASDNKVSITSLQAKEVPKEPTVDIPFEQKSRVARPLILSVTGDYASIRQLVENIQNSQRTLLIDSVIFTIAEQRSRKVLQATITVNVPYYALDTNKPAETPPPAPQP